MIVRVSNSLAKKAGSKSIRLPHRSDGNTNSVTWAMKSNIVVSRTYNAQLEQLNDNYASRHAVAVVFMCSDFFCW